jgi:hypothetical protein
MQVTTNVGHRKVTPTFALGVSPTECRTCAPWDIHNNSHCRNNCEDPKLKITQTYINNRDVLQCTLLDRNDVTASLR